MHLAALFVACIALLAPSVAAQEDGGFDELNDKIQWMTLEDAKKADNKKPFMYLMTQPWCGACKMLKKSFREDGDKLVEVSKHYNMVSVAGDDNKKLDAEYTQSGSYIPRVMFADSGNKFHPEIVNTAGSEQHKYFYTSANLVAKSLEDNLKALTGTSKSGSDL